MYTQNWVATLPNPQSFVTKNKQRLKQINGNVYLKNDDSFEIELFNPLTETVLAKIKLNGEWISNGGIVLRPGERIFLERFLDTNNKFTFTTYDVDGGDTEVQNAIRLNGLVEISFFREKRLTNIFSSGGISWGNSSGWSAGGTTLLNSNATYTTSNSNPITFTTTGMHVPSYTTTFGTTHETFYSNPTPKGNIETGVVEKGEVSTQTFDNSDKEFDTFCFHTVSWKILPHSQKVFDRKDIRNYCGECGSRIKKSSYKFCPHCGTKID